MDIMFQQFKVRDIVNGYSDNNDDGVVGYGGKLDIRPSYQREFVYPDKMRDAVIDTVVKGYPLNIMYWAVREDGTFELMDGQQRTLSICKYVNGDFSINARAFHNLTQEEKDDILDYRLSIYVCRGSEKEKMEWFRIINTGGLVLTDQELRNAVYHGTWLHDAKRYFSKVNCPAHGLAKEYLKGEYNRQAYLEAALEWICDRDGIKVVEEYMGLHQHDPSAIALWRYFTEVINWVNVTFPKYRKEMKGLPWGILYNKYGKDVHDPSELESKISKLMQDDDVTKRTGIYEYLLSDDDRKLSLRAFTPAQKRRAFEKQAGVCPMCELGVVHAFEDMEADHIVPWSKGGRTIDENCQMLCRRHNNRKGGL